MATLLSQLLLEVKSRTLVSIDFIFFPMPLNLHHVYRGPTLCNISQPKWQRKICGRAVIIMITSLISVKRTTTARTKVNWIRETAYSFTRCEFLAPTSPSSGWGGCWGFTMRTTAKVVKSASILATMRTTEDEEDSYFSWSASLSNPPLMPWRLSISISLMISWCSTTSNLRFIFLDAIASPSTYPCQWVSHW